MTIDRFVDPSAAGDADRDSLAGRTALVTGGGRRIGHEMALALGGRGAHVVVHHHSSGAEAQATVAEIVQAGGRASLLAGDLADPAVAGGLVARAADLAGDHVDILVNNAAQFVRCGALDTDLALWDTMHAVNLRAPFLLSQDFARRLPDDWTGDIINLNDARAPFGDDEHFAYTITKVGLQGLTLNLARALAPRIQVNELALGAVLPPDGGGHLRTSRGDLPLGRFPRLDEVVAAMLFLLGTRGVTGQTIRLDGGQFSA